MGPQDAPCPRPAKKRARRFFCCSTKSILLADKSKLLPLIRRIQTLHDFQGDRPDLALKKKRPRLNCSPACEGSAQCPRISPKIKSRSATCALCSELIRDTFLHCRRMKKWPHAVSLLIEHLKRVQDGRIAAVIFCERDGKRPILLGNQADKCSRRLEPPLASTSKGWSRRKFF